MRPVLRLELLATKWPQKFTAKEGWRLLALFLFLPVSDRRSIVG
jgi:hypothetical protein